MRKELFFYKFPLPERRTRIELGHPIRGYRKEQNNPNAFALVVLRPDLCSLRRKDAASDRQAHSGARNAIPAFTRTVVTIEYATQIGLCHHRSAISHREDQSLFRGFGLDHDGSAGLGIFERVIQDLLERHRRQFRIDISRRRRTDVLNDIPVSDYTPEAIDGHCDDL